MQINNAATSTAMQAAVTPPAPQAAGGQKTGFDPQTLLQNALQRSVSNDKGLLASTAVTTRATAVFETSKSDRLRALATRLSPRQSLIRNKAMRSYKEMADGSFLDDE
jgi:hypothetical protein